MTHCWLKPYRETLCSCNVLLNVEKTITNVRICAFRWTPSQPYHHCDRHSATEMSRGASPNVLTIVSVCVSDREWLEDTEGALYWVDDLRIDTHTHPHTHRHTQMSTHIKVERQCTLSLSVLWLIPSFWRRDSIIHSISLTQRKNIK